MRGLYLHVPFCASRCAYCDFNTYVAAAPAWAAFVSSAVEETARAGREWPGVLDTVFFGGGTPTLLPVADVVRLLESVREHLGLAREAEVTIEANPDSVDPRSLAALREAGFTRVSLGMQSRVGHVLQTLGRSHPPQRPLRAAQEARAAGFEHVSLDLIYGTPGETGADWRTSVEAVLAAPVDHVSAYALQVEPGTALAARVRRGALPPPDDDVLAARYALADEAFAAAGLRWYEISNWARPGAQCRHNLGYWRGGEWWGVGPGAHSHVDGERWWNVRSPREYARRLSAGRSPRAGDERPDADARRLERLMLAVRLSEGFDLGLAERPAAAADLAAAGLLELDGGRAVLTRRGRMLADRVVLELAGP